MAAAAAVFLASCGGKEDDVSGGLESAEPVTLAAGSTPKEEYVAKINAICALEDVGINKQVRRALKAQAAAGKSQADAFVGALADVFPLIEESFQRAYAIPPPPGDRDDLEQFFGYVKQSLGTSNEYFEAYEAGDTERLNQANERLDQQESANAFAKAYGIQECTGFTDSQATALETQVGPG